MNAKRQKIYVEILIKIVSNNKRLETVLINEHPSLWNKIEELIDTAKRPWWHRFTTKKNFWEGKK